MIFSTLFKGKRFKAKWQNKNSNVRIEAITDELEPTNEQNQQVLIEILNNDDVELVRRAALIKLAKVEQYLLSSQQNKHAKLKEFAQKQLMKMLMGEHDVKLSTSEKKSLLEHRNEYGLTKNILENWLFKEQDINLVQTIFDELSKPQLLFSLFTRTPNEAIQLSLVEQTDDLVLLEKLLKKSTTETIKNRIKNKLDSLHAEIEKPIKIRKKIQLLLSKFLALKDNSDYEQVIQKREQIGEQWHFFQTDFDLFNKEEQQQFQNKYQEINNLLTKIFVLKEEQYQQAKIVEQLTNEQHAIKQSLHNDIDKISAQLVCSVFENIAINHNEFTQKLTGLTNKVNESLLNHGDKQLYIKKIVEQQKRLSQLPEIANSISAATSLISKIASLSLPGSLNDFNERYEVYQDWIKEWLVVEKQSDGLLPESILGAYQEITQRWQQGISKFVVQQNKIFHLMRKKINDIRRLLNSGKYNACFGLYKKIQHDQLLLSVEQQQKFSREFSLIDKKMAEISDWEHYIATPKKQELLLLVETLVKEPCDNPNAQADKVKQYRKQWQMLGHAEDNVEQLLNEKFNEYCEQAFAPCRVFYAEQEKIRELHAQQRVELINEAKLLAEKLMIEQEQEINWKSLDAELIKLRQKWQKSGEVARDKYKPLLEQYNKVLAPVKKAIQLYHNRNIELKTKLINQAEQLLNVDDNFQAIPRVKELQVKWKDIGFAGTSQENKLWQSFRKINDQIFAQRDQVKQQQQSLFITQENQFSEELGLMTQQLVVDNSMKNLKILKQKTELLLEKILNNKPSFKKVANQVALFIQKLNDNITREQQQQNQLMWKAIFSLLTQIAKKSLTKNELLNTAIYNDLTAPWQKRFVNLVDNEQLENKELRDFKTLELEILSSVESPKEFNKQRMKVQVKLMQTQMTSNIKSNRENIFIEWLQLGKVTENNLAQLVRIEPLFLTASNSDIEKNSEIIA